MKKIYNYVIAAAFSLLAVSCNDFIEVRPTGVIDDELAYSSPEEMCTAAYASLGDCWYTYPFNLWPFGDLASDDCYKGGSGIGDTNWHAVEIWSNLTSQNPDHADELWYHLYCSISRCNRALVSLADYGNQVLGEDLKKVREGEMRFIRGHFYFKLAELYYRVPWVDEEVLLNDAIEQTSNNLSHEELMAKIIADFEAAYEALPMKQKDGGRVNKVAAAAYLAKCYLYEAYGDGYEENTGYGFVKQDYMKKVLDYTKVVEDAPEYNLLEDFGDVFLPANKNSKESVFAIQTSHYTEDNTVKGRANWSNVLNGCWGIWSKGWDFHKPSQNLVNAFKTQDGLPMFEHSEDVHNSYPIKGIASQQKYDPRLFHTVGMPSWPYKYQDDLVMTKDNSRNPGDYGYYTSIKEVPQRGHGDADETYVENTWQSFATADYVFRYSDVMLMRAEAMIETDDLNGGMRIINSIRKRAKDSVAKHIGYAAEYCDIAEYQSFPNKDYARKALRWERRVELAMESSRFFDLRRWGMCSQTLKDYFRDEQKSEYEGQKYAQYYKDASFTKGKNEYWPIPFNQMFYVPGLYTQTKGYN